MNLLYEQHLDFQTLSEEELPNGALTDPIIKECEYEDVKPKMSTECMYSGIIFNRWKALLETKKGLTFCLKLPE